MDYKSVAKKVFLVSAVYDLVLGLIFFFFYGTIFNYFSIPLPEFPQYLQMSAAFVAVLGIGYYFIYRNIENNSDLWKLGILYKVIYSSLVLYYYFIAGTSNILFLYFAIIDILFLIPFIGLYNKVYIQ